LDAEWIGGAVQQNGKVEYRYAFDHWEGVVKMYRYQNNHLLGILLLLALVALAGCSPTALANPQVTPPSPSATPNPSPVPTEAPTTVTGPTIAPATTPVAGPPLNTITANAGIWIDGYSGTWQKTIAPNETVSLPLGTGSLYFIVHYPGVIPSSVRANLRVQITSTTGAWQLEAKNPPTDDTYAFAVNGNTVPGQFSVQVSGDPSRTPIRFTVQVTQEAQVTLADNRQTFELSVTERFLLNLGEGYDWTINIDDQSVVSRVVNITPIRGSQGVFEAHRPGRATLTATGNPTCRSSQPPCSLHSVAFQLTILVKAVGSSLGQDTSIASLQMLSATEGWAISGADNNRTPAVLVTHDGGRSWNSITPPSIGRLGTGSLYVADMQNAWVAGMLVHPSTATSQTSMVTVYRTRDGGQTWQPSAPITTSSAGGPGSITFVDSQSGWLMMSLGAGAGQNPVAIYRTSDGGASWQQVSSSLRNGGGTNPGALPIGCPKNGLVFLDATTGFATGNCPGGTPFFYATHDAGQTWQLVTLPPPPNTQLFPECECDVEPPQFFSTKDGVLLMRGFFGQGNAAVVYVTHDGGATWRPEMLPNVHSLVAASFIDENDGWVADGAQLYVTHDGGATWTTLAPNVNLTVRSLDFATAQNGWAIPPDVDANGRPYLFTTSDGGTTWQTFYPQLAQ
jgi:photosystem II stability/assembly factor-like uncharacterized protein